MDNFQFFLPFSLIVFCSFFLAFSALWIPNDEKIVFKTAFESLAVLFFKGIFKPFHYALWVASKALGAASVAVQRTLEIISVFLRAIIRILFEENRASQRMTTAFLPMALIGIVFFLTPAAVSVFVRPSEPEAHDEFGYLLQSDTFAHGRLTNPTHPLWPHFESFHTIQQPSYTAKYPPAQGLFLALGQRLTGRPIVGVWLSFALMLMALFWALSAFFSIEWAFLATLLAGVRLGFIGQPDFVNGFGYWSQSYWGGAVAALGGALLFGSLRRLWDNPSPALSIVLGFGLAILANSRPYEGLLVSLPAGAMLAHYLVKDKRFSTRRKIFGLVLPLGVILAGMLSWMAYYNWRVTGDPFKTPYSVHEKTYGMPPLIVGQSARPKKEFHHQAQKDYYGKFVYDLYEKHSSVLGFINLTALKIVQTEFFFLGLFLLVPLICLKQGDIAGDPWSKFIAAAFFMTALGSLPMERRPLPHYLAPLAFPIYFFAVKGLVRLKNSGWGAIRPGKMSLLFILALSIAEMAVPLGFHKEMPASHWHNDRARILKQLRSTEGRHLVIVRYSAGHSFHHEWVYNGADIDGAKVVWARELAENDELIRYFAGRRIWLLEADKQPVKLVDYESGISFAEHSHP